MAEPQSRLAVELQDTADVDAEQLAQLASGLRAELLELGVEAVESQRGRSSGRCQGCGPDRVRRTGGPIILNPPLLESVVAGFRSWVGRQQIRSVKLTLDGDTLEVTGLSSAEQDRLVNLWIVRHAGAH